MPDYHSMSLVELKQAAKEHRPRIKQYYIKSRAELIQILTMHEFTEDMIVAKKTIAELRKEAQNRGLPNLWKMRRSELVEVLYPRTNQKNENHDSRNKHNEPQKGESNEVRVDVLKNAT